MDELFHVPQAREFCDSLRSRSTPKYDKLITTPPGLYVLPSLLSLIHSTFCDVQFCRALSAMFVLLCALETSTVLRLLRNRDASLYATKSCTTSDSSLHMAEAVLITLHPPLFFYGALFYTDTIAMYLMLLCWRLSLSSRQRESAFVGIMAVLCRQTCAVFHGCIAFDQLLASFPRGGRALYHAAWPHTGAGALYIFMFAANGFKVVLGDEAHHSPTLHFAMIAYYGGFCFAFGVLLCGGPALCRGREFCAAFGRVCKSRIPIMYIVSIGVLAACIYHTGQYVHPFALADNRHYTFYLYRKFLMKSALHRYLPLPFYASGLVFPFAQVAMCADCANVKENAASPWYAMAREMAREVVFLSATVVAVLPASLLELRYFVPGFVLCCIRVVARSPTKRSELPLVFACLVPTNLLLYAIFCELPFSRPVDPHMSSDLSPGRFMF